MDKGGSEIPAYIPRIPHPRLKDLTCLMDVPSLLKMGAPFYSEDLLPDLASLDTQKCMQTWPLKAEVAGGQNKHF